MGLDQSAFNSLKTSIRFDISSDFCLRFGHSDIVCPYETYCKFRHNDRCPQCDLYCVPKYNLPGERKHDEEECQMNKGRGKDLDIQSTREKTNKHDEECELCKKYVSVENPIFSRFYGILPNCDHVVCLQCAAKLRVGMSFDGRHNIIICPCCRSYSPFYAASSRWITGAEKAEFLTQTVESFKTLVCQFCTEASNSEVPHGTNICYHFRAMPNGKSLFTLDS